MDYEGVKDAAEDARCKIDKLICSLRPDSNYESVGLCERLQSSLRSVDSDQMHDAIEKVLLNQEEVVVDHVPRLELPYSIINPLNNQHNVIKLLHEEEVKPLLGTGKFQVDVSLFSIEGKVCEPPHGDYCDVDDDICYDVQALQQLKQTDPKAWEYKRGEIQYARITQQILQAILSCDLSISVDTAKAMTARAMCMSVSWLHAGIPKFQSNCAIQKVFEGLGYNLKERNGIKPAIQIEIGNNYWDDDSFGLGMILNSTITVELHAESPTPSIERNLSCSLIIDCLVRTSIPLDTQKASSEGNVFRDCQTIGTGESYLRTEGELLFDCSQAALLLSFYKPSFSGTYEYPVDHSRPTKKYECRKSIKDAISEFMTDTSTELPMSTLLCGWGDIFNYLPNNVRNKRKTEETYIPTEIIFDSISAREVIRSVACSSCHILALTNLGMVYSCGDGSHGQLGHDSLDSSHHLRPITYFIDGSNNEIKCIVQISAGSGRVGSHSAAVDTEGSLYSWGKTIMCGHFAEIRHNSRDKSLTLLPKKVKVLEQYYVVKASCGDDHTLVLTRYDRSYQGDGHTQTNQDTSTKVFAWGVVANGRLGHGRPEKVKEPGSMRKKRTRASERFDSRPSVILALQNEQIVDISAGKHHSLALSKDGRVFAWGSNAFGQCGVVQFDTHCIALVRGQRNGKSNDDVKEENTHGIWDDIWLPRHLSEFGSMTGKLIASISAGGIHSAAIDKDGKLYTWGGGGDKHCLGHGDSFNDKNGFDFPSESHRRKLVAMAGCLEVPPWGRPREIKCLEGECMRYVDLGEYGGAAISNLGRMYVWGDKSLKLKMERAQDQDSFLSSFDIPSTPLAFDAICDQRYICDIACGLGTTFYISSENLHGNVLGRRLHDECQSIRRTYDEYDYETLIDCILMCADGKLFCHRVVIAHRSPVLDQMLALKVRPQDASKYFELIIPGIRYQIMKQVLSFMYTGTIPDFHLFNFDMLIELWEASHTLMVEQLMHKCKQVLEMDHSYSISSDLEFVTPPINPDWKKTSSFCSDMDITLQDGRFSDVWVVAEEKTIMAHRCILSTASGYFAKVLDKAKGKKKPSKVILELPGTYSGAVRLLTFLYTGYLSSSYNENDLIEDLENAHRYKLPALKYQIDNRIQVTEENACDMLLLAHKVQSPRLRTRSMHMIVNTLGKQCQDESKKKRFESLLSQCPIGIKDDLFELIKDKNGLGCILPPDRKLLATNLQQRYLRQKSLIASQMTNELIGKDAKGLSTKSTIMLLILAIGYAYLQQFMSVKGLTPIVNCIVLVATCIHFFQRIK